MDAASINKAQKALDLIDNYVIDLEQGEENSRYADGIIEAFEDLQAFLERSWTV